MQRFHPKSYLIRAMHTPYISFTTARIHLQLPFLSSATLSSVNLPSTSPQPTHATVTHIHTNPSMSGDDPAMFDQGSFRNILASRATLLTCCFSEDTNQYG